VAGDDDRPPAEGLLGGNGGGGPSSAMGIGESDVDFLSDFDRPSMQEGEMSVARCGVVQGSRPPGADGRRGVALSCRTTGSSRIGRFGLVPARSLHALLPG
jgi:hypothetical protein